MATRRTAAQIHAERGSRILLKWPGEEIPKGKALVAGSNGEPRLVDVLLMKRTVFAHRLIQLEGEEPIQEYNVTHKPTGLAIVRGITAKATACRIAREIDAIDFDAAIASDGEARKALRSWLATAKNTYAPTIRISGL